MNIVEVFVCYNPIEADRALAILRAAGIRDILTRDLSAGPFPVNNDSNARITLGVLADDAPQARDALVEAVRVGDLQGDGTILA